MLAIFLDLETTGLDYQKHHVIDVAFKIINLSLGALVIEFQSLVRLPITAWDLRDLHSIEINGYTWEEIEKGAYPFEVGRNIVNIFLEANVERGKAVFICQNPGFDRAFFNQLVDAYTQESLNWPYHWLDLASMYWAFLCRKQRELLLPLPDSLNLSKNEIAKTFNIAPEEMPHRAINGVNHLIQCYKAVLESQFQYQ